MTFSPRSLARDLARARAPTYFESVISTPAGCQRSYFFKESVMNISLHREIIDSLGKICTRPTVRPTVSRRLKPFHDGDGGDSTNWVLTSEEVMKIFCRFIEGAPHCENSQKMVKNILNLEMSTF